MEILSVINIVDEPGRLAHKLFFADISSTPYSIKEQLFDKLYTTNNYSISCKISRTRATNMRETVRINH